jgi:hypothetical protein
MLYETLRRLGKDVLVMQEQVDENLLEKLLPSSKDTEWYKGFFGERETWTIEYLAHHLKTLHGSSNLKIDRRHEQQLGFIVAHVRSNRYSAVEMQAIIKVCKIVRVAWYTRTLTTCTFACKNLHKDQTQTLYVYPASCTYSCHCITHIRHQHVTYTRRDQSKTYCVRARAHTHTHTNARTHTRTVPSDGGLDPVLGEVTVFEC